MNEKNISPEPGLRIRALREKLGYTRREFEELTGFKANTLRHLETGTQLLTPPAARMLANFFIYRFEMEPEEASEQFILHGEK